MRRFATLLALVPAALPGAGDAPGEGTRMNDSLRRAPQLTTSSRLLKLGESIELRFHLPAGASAGPVEVFSRYLEHARPGRAFKAGGDLAWLNRQEPERFAIRFQDGAATLSYTPKEPGSYLARWRAGGEEFIRYFAAVEDDWIVLRFSAFEGLESEPTLHATGIPLDYRLPVDRFMPEDALFARFLGYHRHFGDTIIPAFPDTPDLSVDERAERYGAGLAKVRALLPDPSDGRTARLDMRHDLDPGYTETFLRLGVNDHCGLNEANARPWLGMPEFPYFSSPIDCRKANQSEGGGVVAHQWDFCGGWHFLGPVSWHYKAAEGDWTQTERCLRQGAAELANLAEMSGHPAFAVPLYDGVVGAGYPNPSYEYGVGEPRCFQGDVSDVFIAGRALGPQEIARAMQEGAASLGDVLAVWRLDEGKGKAIAAAAGPGGELVGGSSWVEGRKGPALRLDGQDDWVTMRAPVAIRTVDFTLGCWVRPAASQRPWANLLSSHNNGTGSSFRGISLEQVGEATNRFYLIAGAEDRWVGQTAATQLQAGEWQHFAVVRRGTTFTHYLNGQVSARGEVPDGVFPPATDPFRIGNWARGDVRQVSVQAMHRFVERYQRFIAFELPKRHKVVFARSIDISDYYRRHFRATPRTVFVSKTDHVLYDRWWLCDWCNNSVLVPRERIPWDTRVSSIHRLRDAVHPFKDPLSHEYLVVEDQKRHIRFERECPNPIWWYDYTRQERGPKGSAIDYVRTPDVDIRRSAWVRDSRGYTMTLRMLTSAEFPCYAICLWGLPADARPDASRIETDASEFLLAHNDTGEYHLVLFFDLKPGAVIRVTMKTAAK